MQLRSARLALLAALLAVPATATVVIAQSLEQMARTSPLVVRARVGQIQASWNEENTTIETWVDVVVTETLKGKAQVGASLMIRNPGGIVGDRGARVYGSPQFTTGEDTLLFLEPAADKPG